MDHKRGHNYIEDQALGSPTTSASRTKHLKDLSHQQEYPTHEIPKESTPLKVIGKDRDIFDSSKFNSSRSTQSDVFEPKSIEKSKMDLQVECCVKRVFAKVGTTLQIDIEKIMEHDAYCSLLPLVKEVQFHIETLFIFIFMYKSFVETWSPIMEFIYWKTRLKSCDVFSFM